MTIATRGIQTGILSNDRVIATFLAQEGIEAIISIRNQAFLEAFDTLLTGGSGDPWNWLSSVADCQSTNGCNTDFTNLDPLPQIIACPTEGCPLYRHDSGLIRYRSTQGSGELSPYRRSIVVTSSGSNIVKVESTVFFESGLFGGQTQSVTFKTELYNTYGDLF